MKGVKFFAAGLLLGAASVSLSSGPVGIMTDRVQYAPVPAGSLGECGDQEMGARALVLVSLTDTEAIIGECTCNGRGVWIFQPLSPIPVHQHWRPFCDG